MISVIIPTYNRCECVKEILNNSISVYTGKIFCFEIHDSSTSNITEELVKEFCTHNEVPLKYKKYNANLKVDEKVLIAINENKNDFFYLCGDGVFIDFNELERVLLSINYTEFDILNIEESNRIGYRGQDANCAINKVYQFNDNVEYISKYFSHLTYWGASIIAKSFYDELKCSKILEKYIKKNLWWLACVIAEGLELYLNQCKNCIVGTIYVDCVGVNRFKDDHMWTKGDNYYYVTFTMFNEAVEMLPNCYDGVKDDIVTFFRNDSLATRRYIARLRGNGTINLKRTLKYKKDINRVSGLFGYMLFVSLIPECLLNTLYNFYVFIKQYKRTI